MSDNLGTLATQLLDARRHRKPLDRWPSEVEVSNVESAYRVQDLILAQTGPIGGWKLAANSASADNRCSPIPLSQVLRAPVTLHRASLIAPRIEVEIAVRIATDLPGRPAPYTHAEVCAAIGSLHPSFEILDSRYADTATRSVFERLADLQTNGAIVYGQPRHDWRDFSFERAQMFLRIDGKLCATADGGPDTSMVLDGLTWLANHAAHRTGGLKAGQVVITGAPNMAAVAIGRPAVFEGSVDGLGSLELHVA